MNQPLITKYRPDEFDQFVGHEAPLRALKRALTGDAQPRAFLFLGPPGIGKTSLARASAKHLECDITEIDAASNSGVDAMRALKELAEYRAMTANGLRAIIIDECHALSKPAWQALLKLIEEPPEHVRIMLCTTEADKVPATIQSRTYQVALKPLAVREIHELLEAICDMEGWKVEPDVMTAVVQAAGGLPRKALSMIQAVWDVPDRDEVHRVLSLMDDSQGVSDLAKALVEGKPWEVCRPLLQAIEDSEWDSACNAIARYIGAVMLKAETPAKAKRLWILMDALLFPTSTFDRKAAGLVAIGRVIFGKED